MTRPRVSFLLMWPDHFGGTELATFHVANSLVDTHDVEILGMVHDAEESFFAKGTVAVHHLVPRSSGPTTPAQHVPPEWEPQISHEAERALAERLANHPPDVLFATTPPLLALAVQLAPPSTLVVGVEHRATARRGRSMEGLRQYGALADTIVVLTSEGAEWLDALLGEHVPEVRVIPNMVRPGPSFRSALVQPVIVTAGRFSREKQFEHLIEAFAPVAEQHPDWTLRIIGDGPRADALRRLVRRLGLHGRVELVPPVGDIPLEFARASALALTSASEGLPNVILEAFCAGLPVVAYDCPVGPRHMVEHEVSGLLVPPDDIEALSAALARIATDHDLRRRLGQGSFDRRRAFAPDVIAALWRDLLDTLLERRDPRRAVRTPRAGVSRPPLAHDGDDRAALEHAVAAALRASGATVLSTDHDNDNDHDSEMAIDITCQEAFLGALCRGDTPVLVSPVSAPRDTVTLRTDAHPVGQVLRGEPGVRLRRRTDPQAVSVVVTFRRPPAR